MRVNKVNNTIQQRLVCIAVMIHFKFFSHLSSLYIFLPSFSSRSPIRWRTLFGFETIQFGENEQQNVILCLMRVIIIYFFYHYFRKKRILLKDLVLCEFIRLYVH